MKDFCVIGSGISGATIANHLSKKYIVDVYDKARGAGGRASNKKFNLKKSFDHGAQYISPKNIKFKRFVDNLISKKILKKWPGKHLFLKENIKENKKHIKIIGKNGPFTPPMFSKFYNLKTVKEENDQGFWYGWDITAGDFLSNEDSGLYNTAKGVSQDVNTGVAKVKHESEEDKKTDSPY